VRRASWASVLAGATAGIGYGAHGMWMWHSPSGTFQARGASLEPCHWPQALAFPGALDISLMARLFTDHRLDRLVPAQELLADSCGDMIRCAASPDRSLVALHLPFCRDVEVLLDLTAHRVTGWDLAERVPLTPDVAAGDGRTCLRQLSCRADQLWIAERVPHAPAGDDGTYLRQHARPSDQPRAAGCRP
jgi:hypothetical protein